MIIAECKRLTEVVTDEGGDEAGDEISFIQLKYFELEYLPSLKGFNMSNHTIRFPLLGRVTVTECPELKIFSNGVVWTPKLWGSRTTNLFNSISFRDGDLNSNIKRYWEKSFDTCIQQLFTEKSYMENS